MVNQTEIQGKSQQKTAWKLTKEEHFDIDISQPEKLKDSVLIHRYQYLVENPESIFTASEIKVFYHKNNKPDSKLFFDISFNFSAYMTQPLRRKLHVLEGKALLHKDSFVFLLAEINKNTLIDKLKIIDNKLEDIDANFRNALYKILNIEKSENEYQEEMIATLENGSFKDAFEIAKEAQTNKKYEVIWNLVEIVDSQISEELSTESSLQPSNENVENNPEVDISEQELKNLYKEIINNPDNPHRKEAAKSLFDLLFIQVPPPKTHTQELKEYREQLIRAALLIASHEPLIKDSLNTVVAGYLGGSFNEKNFSFTGDLINDVISLLDSVRKLTEKNTALEIENKQLQAKVKELEEKNERLIKLDKFATNPQVSFNENTRKHQNRQRANSWSADQSSSLQNKK